jgi:catechol 2,3-dioxygenase
MSFDDLPPLPPLLQPGADAYAKRIIARSSAAMAASDVRLDLRYGTDYWQKVDLYLPASNARRAPLPVLCFIHGGAWVNGCKEWLGFMAPPLIDAPMIFVSISHRLAPACRLRGIVDDCADALAWVYRHIGKHGGDPNGIHVGGHSAGAHLASTMALRRDLLAARGLPRDVVKACFPISGSYDFRFSDPPQDSMEYRFLTTVLERPEDAWEFSPLRYVGGNDTPFYVTWGEHDFPRIVHQGEALSAALTREPGLVRREVFAGHDHFTVHENCVQHGGEWSCVVRQWVSGDFGLTASTREEESSMPEPISTIDARPVFTPRRLGHVNLIVDELNRSTRFYNQVCGLALEFTEVGLKANFLGTGNTPHDVGMIECTHGQDRHGRDGHLQIPAAAAAHVALNHIAWEMATEADLVAGFTRARNAGLAIGRTADHQIAHSVYMHDPDGNMVEFYADTVKDWRGVLHGEVDLITSRWDPATSTPSTEPLHDPSPEVRQVPEAPLHPQRLTHAVLATNNVAAMRTFYERVGGLTVVFATPDDELALFRGSHAGYRYHLAIVAAPPGAKPGLHHFSFEVESEALDRAAAGLATHGFTLERKVDGPLKRSLFLIDPDGFRVEFFVNTSNNYAALRDASAVSRPFLI